MLNADWILELANEMLGEKKQPDRSLSTLVTTANTRDLVLSNVESLEDTLETIVKLLGQLDMLDDQAFITMAVARTLQIVNKYSSDVLDVMEE